MLDTLFSLSYFSRSLLPSHGEEMEREIMAILQSATLHNAEQHITGALFVSQGRFAQVLEGPQQAVEETFERILNDPRHTDIAVLHVHHIGERSFPEWTMACLNDDNACFSKIFDQLDPLNRIERDEQGRTFIDALRVCVCDMGTRMCKTYL